MFYMLYILFIILNWSFSKMEQLSLNPIAPRVSDCDCGCDPAGAAATWSGGSLSVFATSPQAGTCVWTRRRFWWWSTQRRPTPNYPPSASEFQRSEQTLGDSLDSGLCFLSISYWFRLSDFPLSRTRWRWLRREMWRGWAFLRSSTESPCASSSMCPLACGSPTPPWMPKLLVWEWWRERLGFYLGSNINN